MKSKLSVFLGLILLVPFNFACASLKAESENPSSVKSAENQESTAKRLTSSDWLGIETVYYKIPSGLGREDLVGLAQKLHKQEPQSGLIFVDDESELNEYIKFVTLINPGYNDPEMPKEWADKHIIANVQIYLGGRAMLCEGYGNKEIAELK